MKLLSDQIIHSQGSEYLAFEVNQEQRAFLTPSIVIQLAKRTAPSVNLDYSAPSIMENKLMEGNPDDNGNSRIDINVAEPYKGKLVKEILTQYVLEGLLTLKEAYEIYQPVCQILNIDIESNLIIPSESVKIEADIGYDFKMKKKMSLLEGIITSYGLSIKEHAEQGKKQMQAVTAKENIKKENDDDFGSGLTGLRGAFNK